MLQLLLQEQMLQLLLQELSVGAACRRLHSNMMCGDQQLGGSVQKLILAMSLVLQWSECAVASARLHPLAQRLIDGGLLPHIEGELQLHESASLERRRSTVQASYKI